MTGSATSPPSFVLRGITKSHGHGAGAFTALRDVNLEIARGEFVSIMGPSGSGKTTLLNLIAGIDTPDRGEILVSGQPLTGLPDHLLADRRLQTMGIVFQGFNLIPAFTVAENVALPLRFRGYARHELHQRVATALAKAGISGRDHRRPSELSGGEQQRVAIARAIATEPTILLADEPTGNLDTATGDVILELLRRLNRTQGVTIVMVTHNAAAAAYGDRSIEMRDGRIVKDAPVPALVVAPAQVLVEQCGA